MNEKTFSEIQKSNFLYVLEELKTTAPNTPEWDYYFSVLASFKQYAEKTNQK